MKLFVKLCLLASVYLVRGVVALYTKVIFFNKKLLYYTGDILAIKELHLVHTAHDKTRSLVENTEDKALANSNLHYFVNSTIVHKSSILVYF
ncbi:hypothetical protein NIES2119_12465 [[Phormidium ambiguum] IAM M-71]|uniref:Uncharacterized protein n=1 Tax=[Phormidium ambiguum] IAM M-71 TaxID=454136 RepID=A0A1U7IJY1_9CYAN|nr:hypothetical protein NIES2119_12465 [Phormidium ambiguum IAM M-71]